MLYCALVLLQRLPIFELFQMVQELTISNYLSDNSPGAESPATALMRSLQRSSYQSLTPRRGRRGVVDQ